MADNGATGVIGLAAALAFLNVQLKALPANADAATRAAGSLGTAEEQAARRHGAHERVAAPPLIAERDDAITPEERRRRLEERGAEPVHPVLLRRSISAGATATYQEAADDLGDFVEDAGELARDLFGAAGDGFSDTVDRAAGDITDTANRVLSGLDRLLGVRGDGSFGSESFRDLNLSAEEAARRSEILNRGWAPPVDNDPTDPFGIRAKDAGIFGQDFFGSRQGGALTDDLAKQWFLDALNIMKQNERAYADPTRYRPASATGFDTLANIFNRAFETRFGRLQDLISEHFGRQKQRDRVKRRTSTRKAPRPRTRRNNTSTGNLP